MLRALALALAVLGCAQSTWSAVLGARALPLGAAPGVAVQRATVRRTSAFTMMAGGVAQRWPEIVRSYVAEKFKAIDVDSSGEVDRSELAVLFRSLSPDATEAQIEESLAEFFKKYDVDKSGDIDEEEFFVAVMSNKLLNSDMRLKEQVYVDVLKSFTSTGTKLLTPSALTALEAQLDWEGSNVPIEYSQQAKAFFEFE
jgi:Ca2+-binding EF-hand superfamily protein